MQEPGEYDEANEHDGGDDDWEEDVPDPPEMAKQGRDRKGVKRPWVRSWEFNVQSLQCAMRSASVVSEVALKAERKGMQTDRKAGIYVLRRCTHPACLQAAHTWRSMVRCTHACMTEHAACSQEWDPKNPWCCQQCFKSRRNTSETSHGKACQELVSGNVLAECPMYNDVLHAGDSVGSCLW